MWGYFYIDFERVFAGGSMSSDSRLPSTCISISNFLLRRIHFQTKTHYINWTVS